jgi:hypothetical protein
MFIFRTAFWQSVVVLLLPADPQSGEQAPRVSAIEALMAARTAVADFSAFCDRNPDVCATGGSALQLFTEKVRYGTQRLYDSFDGAPAADGAPDTLKRDDIEPSWRGPPENGKPA